MAIAVRCGTLIDGSGAEPVRGATIVFEGETIVKIDRDGQVPRDAEVIDAGHLTVMPGMIDCHVHLGSSTWSLQQRLLRDDQTIKGRGNQDERDLARTATVTARLKGSAGFSGLLTPP